MGSNRRWWMYSCTVSFAFSNSFSYFFKQNLNLKIGRTAVTQWLRCCATNRKDAGSIPDGVIGIFHGHNSSDRTMTMGSTQLLTEMSTRSIFWW